MTSSGGSRKAPARRRLAPGGRVASRAETPASRRRRRRWTRSGSSSSVGRRRLFGAAVSVVAIGAVVWAVLPGVAESDPAPGDVRVSADGAVVTARWSGSTADDFRVEVARDPGFTSISSEDATSTSVTLEELEPGSTYYLRVRSVTPEGVDSAPSQAVRFTTEYPYEPPTVKASSSTSTTMSVSWKAPEKGVEYEMQRSLTTDFADDGETTRTIKTRKAFKELEPDTLYATRVRVVDEAGEPLSEWSEAATLTTAPVEPLGVGTYNILKWRSGNWASRRVAVADLIKTSNVDVVGLQEAVPSRYRGVPQFQDLVNALGSDWAVTRTSRDATGETRTVYDKTQVELISEGYQTIAGSARFRGVARYIAYAVFEQKSTKKRFLFVNTHYTPGGGAAGARNRAQSSAQLVETVRRVNTDDLPVIIGGDFNSGDARGAGNPVYAPIVNAGFIDPLVKSGELGEAEKVVDGDLKTVNNLSRTAPRRPNPGFIDHLFVSPMRVSQWQVAANLDSAGRFIGTIPSDHNLVRATVWLP